MAPVVRLDSMSERKRTEEDAASYVFERVDHRRLVLMDVPGAPPGTCDFEIQADPVGVLEVTMLADETAERFMAAMDDYGMIDDTGLQSTWIVSLTKGAVEGLRVKELRKDLLPALDALERLGVKELEVRWDPQEPVLVALGNLSVRRVSAMPPSNAPQVHVVGPASTSMVASENAHRAIVEAIAGERIVGKRSKLMRSGAAERHLFVWVMGSRWDAYVGIASDDSMPAEIPSIPDEITTLWVAAESAEGFVVWRSSGGPWQRSVVPSEGFSDEPGSLRRGRIACSPRETRSEGPRRPPSC
jgi:hypothetical protein